MGCASSSTQMDAQAMLEKQRQIMEQRQREFELKRQQQQAATGQQQPQQAFLPGRPPAILTGRPNTATATTVVVVGGGGNGKTGSAPPSPATPLKRPNEPASAGLPKLDTATTASSSAASSRPTSKDLRSGGGVVVGDAVEPSSATSVTAGSEMPSKAEVEARARKYTIDQSDVNARRSKNVHDLAMYGKDVTRRASFNPRPSESPFTPEMQAMMRAGHEAMMAAEAERKAKAEQATEVPLPSFEDEEEEEQKKEASSSASNVPNAASPSRPPRLSSTREGNENNDDDDTDDDDADEEKNESPSAETPAKPKKKDEPEEFDLDPDELRRRAAAEKEKADAVPGLDDPNVARFLAKDGQDRKSKNIHDLGQYFNRRASYVPDVPGAAPSRRASFLPQPGEQARRASMLPPPTSLN